MEKRFAYKFLKKLLKIVDSAQEFIAHLGKVCKCSWSHVTPSFTCTRNPFHCLAADPEAMATSGKTDKSPHDQEIKFFAKVWEEYCWSCRRQAEWDAVNRNWTTATAVLQLQKQKETKKKLREAKLKMSHFVFAEVIYTH